MIVLRLTNQPDVVIDGHPLRFARPLSRRHREIVERVAKGQTNKEIASELSSSPHTISTHLRRLFAEFGVTTRTGLVLRCLAPGLERGQLSTMDAEPSQELPLGGAKL
ncbi:helix-turn-helix transcriptional regulator [Sorangium sp. So ce1014]|uniref:response regulator transcription factor n=1 Tax=Sorangium sp. So ce1014 TaxID=3133326 RepID=UPI003F618B85